MDPPGDLGASTPQVGFRPKLGGAGGGGWKFLQKCVKKQKFCLKMRENRDLRKIFRLPGGGDRVPSCRHRAGGVGQFLAGMQFSTKVLKCVVIC